MAALTSRIRRKLSRMGRRFDAREGRARDLVRVVTGIASSVRASIRNRQRTSVLWSREDQQWHHRWPEGNVNDTARWRSAFDFATRGGGYDMHDLLWRHYKPGLGDVVVDIGAGDGGETLFLAGMVGPTGRVVSIEAAPGPFARLRAMCALNDWPQVRPLMVAIASEIGTVAMSDSKDWVSGNMYEGGGVEVPATSLDDLCDDLGIQSIDWLKMNIEGAEKEAVLGMKRMAPYIRHMTISCHDFLDTDWGRSKEQVTSWLVQHGFVVREHGPGMTAEEYYIYASRTTPQPN